MKNIITISFILLFCANVLSQEYYPISKGEVIKHSFFSLSYSETNEQAEWVYYKLTSDMVLGSEGRTEDFRPDPFVSTYSAQLSDYRASGYDRGHLCPAGDMRFSLSAMSETFYLSNMSPQEPSFNRGIWKLLESTIRMWAMRNDIIYIVTGPIFMNNKGSIGINKVTVPGYYYKVVFDPKKDKKMIAFILPNCKGNNPLTDYVVTVDSVESITNIDFFSQLDDKLENNLESIIDINQWYFFKNDK